MDLQVLKLFRAVADAGSLSKAANELHYAQSNLSTKMIQLEKELHTMLFYRTSHGITLTPKGKILYGYPYMSSIYGYRRDIGLYI